MWKKQVSTTSAAGALFIHLLSFLEGMTITLILSLVGAIMVSASGLVSGLEAGGSLCPYFSNTPYGHSCSGEIEFWTDSGNTIRYDRTYM